LHDLVTGSPRRCHGETVPGGYVSVKGTRGTLGLEFRTDLDEPDGVQQRMLDSFRFTDNAQL
jgi:hypothetical protein